MTDFDAAILAIRDVTTDSYVRGGSKVLSVYVGAATSAPSPFFGLIATPPLCNTTKRLVLFPLQVLLGLQALTFVACVAGSSLGSFMEIEFPQEPKQFRYFILEFLFVLAGFGPALLIALLYGFRLY